MKKSLERFTLLSLVAVTMAATGLLPIQNPISASAEGTDYGYTIIDTNASNLAYGQVMSEGEWKSIVGFTTPDDNIDEVTRMSMEIKFKTYPWWDIAKLGSGTTVTESFPNISSSDLVRYTYVSNDIDQWGNPVQTVNLSYPRIGSISQLLAQDELMSAYIPAGMLKSGHVEDHKLADMDFYVVLPVARTIQETLISIAGWTVDGVEISDGTNNGGFYQDGQGKYISHFVDAPKSIWFPDATAIQSILVTNLTKSAETGYIRVEAGTYDFSKGKWIELKNTYELSLNYDYQYSFDLASMDVIRVTYFSVTTANVKFYYEAAHPAFYVNITDLAGNEAPTITDPVEPKPWWWKLLEAIFYTLLAVAGLTLLVKLLEGISYVIKIVSIFKPKNKRL